MHKTILIEEITIENVTEKINEKIKFMNDTPPSLTCLGAVAFRLYHKNMDFGILHSGAAYAIMAIAKKEFVSKWYTKRKPQSRNLWGFL